jgi:hypothetical protein
MEIVWLKQAGLEEENFSKRSPKKSNFVSNDIDHDSIA